MPCFINIPSWYALYWREMEEKYIWGKNNVESRIGKIGGRGMCSVCGYVHLNAGAHRGQRHWISLEWELQAVVSHFGSCELGPSERQHMLLTAELSVSSCQMFVTASRQVTNSATQILSLWHLKQFNWGRIYFSSVDLSHASGLQWFWACGEVVSPGIRVW